MDTKNDIISKMDIKTYLNVLNELKYYLINNYNYKSSFFENFSIMEVIISLNDDMFKIHIKYNPNPNVNFIDTHSYVVFTKNEFNLFLRTIKIKKIKNVK